MPPGSAPSKGSRGPQTHVTYVAVSRAKTDEPNDETGYESIVLMHPLSPADFAIPEVRKQLIHGEYKRLRALEEASLETPLEGPIASPFNDDTNGGVSRQQPKSMFTYSDIEETIIRNSFRKVNDEVIVADKYGIPINRASLRCLERQTWINDDIINYMFSIWNERATEVESRHFFVSTFFMDRLQRNNYSFTDVREWFNGGADIKNDAILYIPVNIGNTHWTLLVINMLEKSIKYYDGLRGMYHLYITLSSLHHNISSLLHCCILLHDR